LKLAIWWILVKCVRSRGSTGWVRLGSLPLRLLLERAWRSGLPISDCFGSWQRKGGDRMWTWVCSGLSELRPSEVVMAMDSLEPIAVGLARASW
jgi:hypothetical protein